MAGENDKVPFILPQGNFSAYETLAEADAALLFKTSGLEIYIISEDKFYYWDNAWIPQNVTGGGSTTADNVSYDNTSSGLTSTNVQDAIDELNLAISISGVDKNYVHNQGVASAIWNITHNLGKFPSVTVVDSSGREVVGDVQHLTINTLTINFSAGFAGKAYIN